MGTYMTVGIYTKVGISKSQGSFEKHGSDGILGSLSEKLDTSLYDMKESEKDIEWTIKNEVLVNQLLPFLKRQFEYFPNKDECSGILDDLSKLNSGDEIIALSKEGNYQRFQFDKGFDSLSIGKWKDYLKYFYNEIIYCLEGKASMESYYNIFHYLEQMIRLQRQEFPIAGAVKITISG